MQAAAKPALAILLISLAGVPHGCSSSPVTSAGLAAEAAREKPRADASFIDAPIPPGVPAELVAPAPETPELRLTLEEIRDALPAPEPARAASDEPSKPALALYVRGRAALLDGDLERAIELLEESVAEDPAAAAAWRDLGEARRQAGDRFAADAAHREALAVNPFERRSLLRLGLEAADRREFARAVELLSRIDLAEHPGDPAERFLIWSTLGRALIETGHLAAGADLMARGMDVPDRFTRPTIFADELERLYRDRAGAWREIGDAYARLDAPLRALEAYERASRYPSFDPVGLLARRLYALVGLGRPAAAAEALFEAITGEDDGDFTLEDRHVQLIGYVAGAGSRAQLGRAMEGKLTELAAELPESERASLASRLALARSAALPDREAARVLRERLAEEPGDSAAVSALLSRTGADDPASLARQIATLIETSPLNERSYVAAAIRLAGGAGPLLEAVPERPRDASLGLLRARLLKTLGRDAEAERVLVSLVERRPDSAAAVSALAELYISQRRLDEASAAIDRLDPNAGEPALIAKAQALASVGRLDEGVELLRRAASEPDATALVAYRLGQLYEQSGANERAAERYEQAARINPRLEEPHAALIRLYNRTGPLADRQRLFAAVRDLREHIPSARTLRWLRAQELATTGQYGAAERALRDLAEERDDPLVTRALVSVWLATGSSDEAEAWLREQLESRPSDSSLIAQLARALSAQSRHEEAAEILREQLQRRPGDSAISIRLETLLRDALDRPDEADELTLQRLEAAPRTIASAVQEANAHLRQDRPNAASRAALAALESARRLGAAPTPNERNAMLAVAQRIAAAAQKEPALETPAIEIINELEAFGEPLPEAAHRLRTLLLIQAEASTDRIIASIASAYEDAPAESDATTTAAVQSLVQSRPDAALAVVETAARVSPSLSQRLATLWVGILAQVTDVDSSAALLETLVDREAARRTASQTLGEQNRFAQMSQRESAAAIGFALASAASSRDEQPQAMDLYRLTLEFNPDHAMAGNNLGYQLLIDGEVEEAAPIIERAYASDSESPAIIDSYGWLRYIQGVIEDERDAAGEVVREGAMSILGRAVEIALAQNDAGLFELHSHYGDALWRAGRPEEAVAQWRAARDAAQEMTRRFAGRDLPSFISEALESAQARIDAATAGAEPPIAPTAAERRNAERRPDLEGVAGDGADAPRGRSF